MSIVTAINNFFKFSPKAQVEAVRNKIILTERQEYIFNQYYLKKNSVPLIALSLNLSCESVYKELKVISSKIVKAIDLPK